MSDVNTTVGSVESIENYKTINNKEFIGKEYIKYLLDINNINILNLHDNCINELSIELQDIITNIFKDSLIITLYKHKTIINTDDVNHSWSLFISKFKPIKSAIGFENYNQSTNETNVNDDDDYSYYSNDDSSDRGTLLFSSDSDSSEESNETTIISTSSILQYELPQDLSTSNDHFGKLLSAIINELGLLTYIEIDAFTAFKHLIEDHTTLSLHGEKECAFTQAGYKPFQSIIKYKDDSNSTVASLINDEMNQQQLLIRSLQSLIQLLNQTMQSQTLVKFDNNPSSINYENTILNLQNDLQLKQLENIGLRKKELLLRQQVHNLVKIISTDENDILIDKQYEDISDVSYRLSDSFDNTIKKRKIDFNSNLISPIVNK